MSNFKQYKFNSYSLSEIVVAVKILKQLGYKTPEDFFDLAEAVEGGGLCTWDGGYITEGYLYFGTDHEDITLGDLKAIMCGASSLSGEQSSHNAEANENKEYDMFIKFPNKDWEKIDGFHLDNSQVTKVFDDKVYERRLTLGDEKSADYWIKKLENRIEDIKKYRMLFGVQFDKNIYSFRDNHYVHNIIRDKDGDVCVVDQYEIYYKLRDVEFYVSDEHNDTMSYQQYTKFVNI